MSTQRRRLDRLSLVSPRRLSALVVWTRDHDRLLGLLCALVVVAIQLL